MSVISTQDVQEAMWDLLEEWRKRESSKLIGGLNVTECITELEALARDEDLFPLED